MMHFVRLHSGNLNRISLISFFLSFLIMTFSRFSTLFYPFQPVPRCRIYYPIICSCSISGVCSFPSSSRPLAAIGKARLLRSLRTATKIEMQGLLTDGIQCYPGLLMGPIFRTRTRAQTRPFFHAGPGPDLDPKNADWAGSGPSATLPTLLVADLLWIPNLSSV